jgi:hypothetical protein
MSKRKTAPILTTIQTLETNLNKGLNTLGTQITIELKLYFKLLK